MPGRKGSGEKPPLSSPRRATASDQARTHPLVTPVKRPAKWVKRAEPAVAEPAKPPRRDTIEVNSRWLIPSIPEMAAVARPKRSERPSKPAPLPSVLAVKPRGKLPPPLPREDRESVPSNPQAQQAGPQRTSKRPPRAR